MEKQIQHPISEQVSTFLKENNFNHYNFPIGGHNPTPWDEYINDSFKDVIRVIPNIEYGDTLQWEVWLSEYHLQMGEVILLRNDEELITFLTYIVQNFNNQ